MRIHSVLCHALIQWFKPVTGGNHFEIINNYGNKARETSKIHGSAFIALLVLAPDNLEDQRSRFGFVGDCPDMKNQSINNMRTIFHIHLIISPANNTICYGNHV